MTWLKGALSSLFIFSFQAQAHPVPFKDGTAVNFTSQTFESDLNVAYSFHRQVAIAARMTQFESENLKMKYYGTQVNYLLNRWNGEGFQANIYTAAGLGPMTYNENEHSAILTSLDADAESRWLYTSAMGAKMWTGYGHDFWHARARFGVAPYAADFKQLATWLMVQFEYNPQLEGWTRVTPLVRFFYRNYLAEIGVSLRGEGLLNLMGHF